MRRVTIKRTLHFFCNKLQISKEHVKKHADDPFQNIDPMTTLSIGTNILTMIKTFALDIDTVALRYDPAITSVMPWAVGCLTRKNTQKCRALFAQCRALYVDLFHFLLFLVTFLLLVTFVSYFLLLKGVRFATFCYFFYCW